MTNDEFAERIVGMTQTLYRVCYAMLPQAADREDAVQECLKKAWEKRGSLRDERYLQTWVIRILINECHNIQRRAKREAPAEALPDRPAPEGADRELHDALLKLETKLRLPIVLHYMEGYSVAEIARMLRLPAGTVKSRMLRGRKALKDMLTEEVPEL